MVKLRADLKRRLGIKDKCWVIDENRSKLNTPLQCTLSSFGNAHLVVLGAMSALHLLIRSLAAKGMPVSNNLLESVRCGLDEISIVGNVKVSTTVFGAQECKKDDVGVNASHEDANNLAVVVSLGDHSSLADKRFQGEARS